MKWVKCSRSLTVKWGRKAVKKLEGDIIKGNFVFFLIRQLSNIYMIFIHIFMYNIYLHSYWGKWIKKSGGGGGEGINWWSPITSDWEDRRGWGTALDIKRRMGTVSKWWGHLRDWAGSKKCLTRLPLCFWWSKGRGHPLKSKKGNKWKSPKDSDRLAILAEKNRLSWVRMKARIAVQN